jgi:hypothetical protein
MATDMLLQEILDAINAGTNVLLNQIAQGTAQIQADVTTTSNIIENVNSELITVSAAVNRIIPQVEKIIKDLGPAVQDLSNVENNIDRIVTLLFVILIIIIVIIFALFIFWFFKNVYPILRGLKPRPKNFDEFIMSTSSRNNVEVNPVESRKNDVEQFYTASEHNLSRKEFEKRYDHLPSSSSSSSSNNIKGQEFNMKNRDGTRKRKPDLD